jgi:hypothetical protein
LVVGLVGFLVAPGVETHQLVIFDINLPHDVVHLALGLGGLAAYFGGGTASRLYAQVVGVVLLIVAQAGFLPQPLLGLLPVGGADIVLHALTGLLGLYVGFVTPERATAPADAAQARSTS